MTDNEEARWATKSHPYVATLEIDPGDWYEFERRFEERPEVKIRKLDTSKPDTWAIFVACASEAVKDAIESNW